MASSATESRIEAFVARYAPEIAAPLRECRAQLQRLFPRGFELVFDNYNALVFAFGPTARAGDAFLSVAGYPRWLTLFFSHGAQLTDPAGLLEGSGKRVRSIRLGASADLSRPEVQALIRQSIQPHEEALGSAPPLTTTVAMVVATQRPRRPPQRAAKPASRNGPARTE